MSDDRPGYSFEPGPPPEASRYLANKGWKPAFSWLDVEPEEHAVAFTVAKATSMDVLRDIREELQTALDEGLPFAEFRKRLQPRLEARGWWGMGRVLDPAIAPDDIGPAATRNAVLGTPRRLRTIYDANLRSARAAGQWERIERTRRILPYLQYRLGPSEVHRPEHEIKDGLVLPVDDPFWDAWMPPNGWGCKCWVKQISRPEAERQGIDASPAIETRAWTNRRTGEIKRIPRGIDPGWERNPGKLRQRAVEQLLTDRLDQAPDDVRTAALRDVATSWRVTRMLATPQTGRVPVAALSAELAAAVGAERRLVELDARTARKMGRRHPEVAARDFGILAELIERGRVYLQDASHLVFLGGGALPWVAVIERRDHDAGHYLKLATMFRATPERWRMTADGRGLRVR